METIALFNKASKIYSIQELAEKLYLHTGTIKRWVAQNKVPDSYRADFLRILNIEQELIGEREKDQFYTKKVIAEKCFQDFKRIMKQLDINLSKYHFIEPSAGCGCFYFLLPSKQKTGIDIDPRTKGIIKRDYLKWKPKNKEKCIVIGNPPFGLRGNLALKFINHSYEFADVVAFILPQLFESDGKGSTMGRVKGYKLAYSKKLPRNSFYYPNGVDVDINTIFQVWTKIKTEKIKKVEKKTCDEFIKVYSLSDGGTPSSTRNKKMLNKCDIYLPSTTFQKMQVFNSFEELPHKRGYGVIIYKNKKDIKKLLKNNDWNKTAFASTNSALNLRTSLIKEVIMKAGFFDKISKNKKQLTLFNI